MTETSTPEGGAQPQAPAQPSIRVLGQYVKDLSFENPAPLASNSGQNAPAIELGIDVKANPQGENTNVFEVDLRLSAQAKREENVVFIAELVYSGLFELSSAQQEEVEPLLLVECPRLLFPFARRIMAEITREGGFPPLLIDPIDFVGLWRAQRAQAQQQQGEEMAAAPAPTEPGQA